MIIELLYPELSNIYGDQANATYLQRSIPGCEIVDTDLGTTPRFIAEGDVDLVYRGTMTESGQKIFMEEMSHHLRGLKDAIENGQNFLITGNAMECFGTHIQDKEGETIHCLGIFKHHAERDMLHRYNSLYVGKYGETDIVGYKSQFSQSYYDDENIEPLFKTVRGPGLNPQITEEGLRYKNFRSTYLIGPLLVLNPTYLKVLASELGVEDCQPPFEETAQKAFEMRLKEYLDPSTGFTY